MKLSTSSLNNSISNFFILSLVGFETISVLSIGGGGGV